MLDIIKLINKNDSSNNIKLAIEMVTIIVPSSFSLIVAFIKIPEIIARYLFNIKEDEYMASIIENLQNYDKSIYSIEQKINENLKNIPMNNDNEILDYPDEANEKSG